MASGLPVVARLGERIGARYPPASLPFGLSRSQVSPMHTANGGGDGTKAEDGLATGDCAYYDKKYREARVLDFELNENQAQLKYEEWNRKHAFHLSSVWNEKYSRVRALQLPFWRFSARLDIDVCKAKGVVGGYYEDGDVPRETVYEQKDAFFGFDHPDMQIYASYALRRDFVRELNFAGAVQSKDFRPLLPSERDAAGIGSRERNGRSSDNAGESASSGAGVSWDACAMNPSLAWHLAVRNVKRSQMEAAKKLLKNPSDAKRLQVRLTARQRKVDLVFLPVFVLDYAYGTTINISQERVIDPFQAMVGGAEGSGVAGEMHYSSMKVQAATGALCSSVLALDYLASPLLGLAPSVSPELSLTSTFVLCALSGVAARSAIHMKRRDEENKIAETEDESYDYNRLHDESVMQVVEENEWRRWEESEKWKWHSDYREKWARNLFLKQKKRRIDLKAFWQKIKVQQMMDEEEARRELARERRYGKQRSGSRSASGLEYRRGADFMGFYRLLGLGEKLSSATADEIKEAFRREAMRLHPDRNEGKDNKKVAEESFKKLQKAYSVLNDPRQRNLYHKGQMSDG